MYIANEEKVKELQKQRMAQKMRNLSNHILQKMAHNKGYIGKLAARLDSYESRHLDKGKGVYKDL